MNASIKIKPLTIVDVYMDEKNWGEMICFQRRGQPYVVPYLPDEIASMIEAYGKDSLVANGKNCQFHINENVPADVAETLRGV